MKKFLERVQKQGLIKTVQKGFDKIFWYQKHEPKQILDKFLKKAPSFLHEYKNPNDNQLMQVEKMFLDCGVKLYGYESDVMSFEKFKDKFNFGIDFYGGQNNPVWTEKVLEHFIAWEMVVKDLKSDEIYVDVAAASSPWVKLLNEKGVKAIGIDLNKSYKFPDDSNYMVMDATKTTFKDGSLSGISLQCAFEMFTGDDDINLIKELGRILKMDGKAVVVPLYMHTHYCGYTTKEFRFSKKYHDKGAKLYVRKDCSGIPFSRKYDVSALKKRVLDVAEKSGLDYKLYVLRNGKEIHEGVYCHFILELIKR